MPSASSSGKYFWFAFIVRTRHSGGTARNSRVEPARQHVRPLDQRGHLVEQRVVVDRREAAPRRRRPRAGARSRRAARRSSRSPRLRRAAAPRSSSASRRTIGARLPSKRWPCVVRPASRPSARTGTTSSPCSATRPCAGRTKLHAGPAVGELVLHHLRDRQLRDRVVERALQRRRRASRRRRRVSRNSVSPLPSMRRCSRGTTRRVGAERGELLEQRRRRLAVGAEADARRHQLVRDRAIGGARRDRRRSSTASRRGVAYGVTAPRSRRAEARRAGRPSDARRRTPSPSFGSAFGGSSSTNSSTSSGRGGTVAIRPAAARRRRAASLRAAPRPRRPTPSAPSGSRAARGSRGSSARRCAPACGCGRCRRRAR